MVKFKRYCKTLQLQDDTALIEAYKDIHKKGAAWPEITRGMKDVGILDMEIYIDGNRLYMIMDTLADFDHDSAMAQLATLPRQSEWEAYVSQFQKSGLTASADEKWRLLQRIYEIDEQITSDMCDGYEKNTAKYNRKG